ncbi:MAG: hypothetical protein ACREEB_12755 [Caulobacteraceae bacterium]
MFKSKIVAAMIVGLAMSIATLAPAWSQVQDDYLIVPYVRIGAISLGMSDKDMFKLGIPIQTGAFPSQTLYRYQNITVFVDNNSHQVVSVMVQGDNKYHTADGLRIGSSSLRDVEASFGPPDQYNRSPVECCDPVGVFYQSHRLAFEFSPAGSSMADRPKTTVQGIGIQSAGAADF